MKIYFKAAILLLFFFSCKKEDIIADPCIETVSGYVVGFDQCYITKGFIVTTISPPDTLETFNLPDSLYHFPTDASDDLYRNYRNDFLFPPEYHNKYPIRFSYELVPENERVHRICSGDIFLSHYTYTVKSRQIKIKCVTK